jgi:uncharacterized repeat protein (TIGR01451 family)
VTLTLHTLEDSQLGTILLDFPYSLVPGSSAFLTQSVVLTGSVVNTATWTAFNPGPIDVISATDSARVYAWEDACPAGYERVSVNYTDFEEFPPYGWTITNTTTGCSGVPEWTNTDPGTRGNQTGGSGKFAVADSDACGAGSLMNTTMTSAPFDFSGLVNPLLTFHMDYNDIASAGDTAYFDVSLDGGLTWQNFYTWDKDLRGPIQVAAELPGAGEDDVRVRWDYQNASWDWWWEVDGVTVTACGQFPEIELSPDEITGTQAANEVVTHTLTISNLGAAPLTWEIGEEGEALAGTERPMPAVEVTGIGDAAQALDLVGGPQVDSTQQIPDTLPDSPFAPSPTLLYDNGPLVNCVGCGVGGADESVLQTTSLGMNLYGFGNQYIYGHRVADDFTIENEDGWYVDQLTFFAYQTGSSLTSTLGAANLQIWDGPPDDPGSSVVFGDPLTDRLVDSAWSGIYRVTEETSGVSTDRPVMTVEMDVNFFLSQGTYWLDWQIYGDNNLFGPFAPPITINGESTTGNALQYTTEWAPAMDVGQQGFPFLIYGCGLGDIPWASAAPTSGSTPAGEASEVSVLFDSAGLGVGEYSGALCLWSNDRDENLTTVPLTLTVVLGADLSLVKTASKEPVSPGETIEYTLVVENNGPDPASNTTLVDTLPVGVTFDSASAGCVHAGGVVTCNLGTMAAGEVSQVSIIVSAPEEEGVILNSATVAADELDMHPEDNSASLETTVILYRVYLPLATR